MKRMGNHGGSIGSQHQIQGGLGQSQIMGSGSGQNLMSESYQQGNLIIFLPFIPTTSEIHTHIQRYSKKVSILSNRQGPLGRKDEFLVPE